MIRVHFLYMGCHVALVVKTHVAQWTSEEKVSRSMFCCNVSIKLKFFCKTLVAYITFVFVDSLVCFNMPQTNWNDAGTFYHNNYSVLFSRPVHVVCTHVDSKMTCLQMFCCIFGTGRTVSRNSSLMVVLH